MKKKIFMSFYILAALVACVNGFFAVRDTVSFDMKDLPKGVEIHSVASPNGNRVLNVYLVENALGTAIRGEVKNNGKTHNVYWQTGLSDVEYGWIDNDYLIINDVAIDAVKGSYDCRRGYSIFSEGSVVGDGVEAPPIKQINEKE